MKNRITTLLCAVLLVVCHTAMAQQPVMFPANGATEVSIDTHLTLTFSDEPQLGTKGKICVYDTETDELVDGLDMSVPDPVIIHGHKAVFCLHYNKLEYGHEYYVTIDRGVIQGFSGVKGKKGWRFATKAKAPLRSKRHLIVAADGTGDFSTLQGAIDFVPSFLNNERRRFVIEVRNGDYEEQVCFRDKRYLTIQGESRDGVRMFPSHHAVVVADNCEYLQFRNLTLQTDSKRQAVGLLVNGSCNYFENVHIIGSGEALQANGSCYWQDCLIEGDGDTVQGQGPSFFHRCTFVSMGTFTEVRNTADTHGSVFLECKFSGKDSDTVMDHEPDRKWLSRLDAGKDSALLSQLRGYHTVLDWKGGGSLTPVANDPTEPRLVISTTEGDITIRLYNDTPLHRDNFLRLAREGYYDGTLFHRVISDFMIQGGDPDSKGAPAGSVLGNGGPGYTIAAEFRPWLLHRRGALAAAREGDDVNPERRSGGSQFYIVWGRTPEGTPHLDGAYTVFGYVEQGLDVVERILQQPTDANDRPLRDVIVRTVRVN